MAAAVSLPDPSQNPPPPANWRYMPQSDVTPAMTTWSIHLLNDTADWPGPPPYTLIPNVIDGKAIKAQVQSHPPDAQNPIVHRGISLFEPVSPTPPASGIDVSKYQGAPNFGLVKSSGRSFVFCKATEGTSIVDGSFANDWMATRAVGLLRGAYLFFHPSEDGTAQADLFLKALNGDWGELPVTLDFETTDSLAVGNPQIATNLEAAVKIIMGVTGRAPLIYTAPGFWNALYNANPTAFKAIAAMCPLWVAHWGVSTPSLPLGWRNWTFWQYSSSVAVPGVQGPDDADYFNGTDMDLINYVAGSVNPPPPEPPPPGPPPSGLVLTPATVKALQTALNDCNAASPPLVVDGLCGPLTKGACAKIANS